MAAPHGVQRMDPLEVAGGWVHGFEPVPLPATRESARAALDRILLRCLQRTPCLLAFSGGRDSSALLAVAVDLARREGLAEPVAVTLTYPGVAGTDEAEWQARVLDHLDVRNRVTIPVRDEHDVIGPYTAPLLQRHGAIWPPNLAPTWRLMDRARGGTLLIGESGDEVFGIHRITPLRKILRCHGRVDRRVYPMAARSLAPASARRRAALRAATGVARPWLRAAVQEELARRDAADAAVPALHAGRSAWQSVHRTAVQRMFATHRALGQEIDVDYVAPFAHPEFVAALAAEAGFWGWSGRTQAMRRLFGDVLPDAVLARTSKAYFNGAVFTERTRAFAAQWDGSGVDTDLVDPESLREIWLSELPDGRTMALLQQAWLHSTRVAA